MLTVRIELHSAVTGEIKTIAIGKIINIGTGSSTLGNYLIELRDAKGRLWRRGTVENFPRKRLLAWNLLHWGLEKLLGRKR